MKRRDVLKTMGGVAVAGLTGESIASTIPVAKKTPADARQLMRGNQLRARPSRMPGLSTTPRSRKCAN